MEKLKKVLQTLSNRSKKTKQKKCQANSYCDGDQCNLAYKWEDDDFHDHKDFINDANLHVYQSHNLSVMTNDFNEENNLIRNFLLGDVYRGVTTKGDVEIYVTVKVLWRSFHQWSNFASKKHNIRRLKKEIAFLAHPEVNHPYLPEILGYCCDSNIIAVVYLLDPLQTLNKLIDKDCLGWVDRLKIALRVGLLLEYLHGYEPHILVRNLSAYHIILDKDKNPILFEFGALVGGVLPNNNKEYAADDQYLHEGHGYFDPNLVTAGKLNKASDVYSYGVLLLGLIRCKDFEDCKERMICYVDEKTWRDSKNNFELRKNVKYFSVAHSIHMKRPHYYTYDMTKVLKLAMQCHCNDESKRPSMGNVIDRLGCLFVFAINEMGRVPICGSSLEQFSYEDIITITNGFSSFLGKTDSGELYAGKIEEGWRGMKSQNVTVKMWGKELGRRPWFNNKRDMHTMKAEMTFLRHPKQANHPNLLKLLGYCCEYDKLGVIYKLESLGTLEKFLSQDSYQWANRVKAAYECARLLKLMHHNEPPYIVGTIRCYNFLLDQDMKIILVEFGVTMGGILGQGRGFQCRRAEKLWLEFCMYDGSDYCNPGIRNQKVDIYAFGLLLLELMFKRQIFDWHKGEYSRIFLVNHSKYSSLYKLPMRLVIDSKLKEQPFFNNSDGHHLLKMAIACISDFYTRPNVDKCVNQLESLDILCPSRLFIANMSSPL